MKKHFRIAALSMLVSTSAIQAQENLNLKGTPSMKYNIELMEVLAQPALVIRGKAKIEEVGATIGEILNKVGAYLELNHTNPVGAPFTRTFKFEDGILEFESGFPINVPLAGQGEIIRTELPKGTVATTLHIGSQEDSPAAYEALEKWTNANNKKLVGAPWEVYLIDPTSPEKNKLQIFFPIRSLH